MRFRWLLVYLDSWNSYANEVGSWNRVNNPPPPPPPSSSRRHGGGGHHGGGGSNSHCLLMRGLPYKANENDIRKVSCCWGFLKGDHFEGKRCTYMNVLTNFFLCVCVRVVHQFFDPLVPMGIQIIYDSNGRPSGTAKVQFACADDMTRAMGKVII